MTTEPDKNAARTLEGLAAATRAGDEAAFLVLVGRTQGRLVAFLRVLLGCEADAEEVAQEAYLRAWRRRRRYAPGRPYLPWLFTIARRLAIGRLRARGARGPTVGLEAGVDRAISEAPAVEREEERAGVWARVRRLVDPLSAQALWLRYAEDLGAAEIGRILGKREGAVRTLLQRARERLARDPALNPATDPTSGAREIEPARSRAGVVRR